MARETQSIGYFQRSPGIYDIVRPACGAIGALRAMLSHCVNKRSPPSWFSRHRWGQGRFVAALVAPSSGPDLASIPVLDMYSIGLETNRNGEISADYIPWVTRNTSMTLTAAQALPKQGVSLQQGSRRS